MIIGVGLDARLGLPFDQLRAVAREAAGLGFESLWTPAGGGAGLFFVGVGWGRGARFISRVLGLVAGHLAADRDLRCPGRADVDSPGPGGPGGHAGPAVVRTVRARHWDRRLR